MSDKPVAPGLSDRLQSIENKGKEIDRFDRNRQLWSFDHGSWALGKLDGLDGPG